MLDHDNHYSKVEEAVECVECEVIDSKDQITPIEDKYKRESRLKTKKNINEIQNCGKKKSEVNKEREVKNNNGDLNHKVDVYSESITHSKMVTEKIYLNKQKENTNGMMTIDN